MKLIGLMPVRNEAWVLGLSLRAALMWCDEIVVFLHCCEDDSYDIALAVLMETRSLAGHDRVQIIHCEDAEWNEMEQRQWMLITARERGATHIAIVDADEVLSGNLLDYPLRTLPDSILQLPLYNLRGSINRVHSNGIWGHRWVSVAFKDDERLGWKGDQFHHREPFSRNGTHLQPYKPIRQGFGGVMHLWGCSERRLIAKHRLYRITERIRWREKSVRDIEEMYSWATKGTGKLGDSPAEWTFEQIPAEWWEPYQHLRKYLDVDLDPWQDAECERLIEKHGREYFAGLMI